MTTLGDDYPRQQARLRVCLQDAREIGPAGAFYCAICEDILRRADEAAITGDLPAMIAVYQEMKEFEK